MISVNQVCKTFTGVDIFKDITFIINPRDRIGLVGKNGAGKSTLLKIIINEVPPDKGSISIPSDTTLGYLPQTMHCPPGKNVFDETMTTFSEVLFIEQEIKRINEELAYRTDYESKEYMDLIHQLSEHNERYHLLGGDAIDADVEQTLLGLGFKRSDFTRQTTEFSGGWRMRIELAKILLKRPSVFLLDEPTNHLDIESIQWLEDFLKDYAGAVVLISHDRAFLDNVTTRTVEISLGKLYDYKVPYSEYVVLRKERREQQLAAFENQQKMIGDTEEFIERFRYKATKAVQVQSRIKQLDKIDRIEVDDEDNSSIFFRFPPAPRSGTIVVETKQLTKAYGDKIILNEIDFIIERGEKIAFVGRNGEGKTTLSRVILQELDYTGELKLGHNLSIGYYAQNLDEKMDTSKTVLQTLDDIAVGDIRKRLRDILGSFLFRGEDVDKKVSVLSGGERSRLALAKLLLQPYNLLLLDEPTNHLDMRSKEILKEALSMYDGTLIVVSHDRDFLDGLIEKIYEFKDKKLRQHGGGIYDFLKKKKLDNLKELERKKVETKAKQEETISDNKVQYLERKEFEKRIRKIQSQITKSEESIASLEEKIKQAVNQLSEPESNNDPYLYENYESYKQDLAKEMKNWEDLNFALEELEKEKV